MKNKLIFAFTIIVSSLGLNSCEAWEDESYHPGGENNPETPALLLKEVKTTTEDSNVEGVIKYNYDSQSRLTEILVYGDLMQMETYNQTTFQYPSPTKNIMISKTFVGNSLMLTITSTVDVVNATTANVTIQNELTGDISSVVTLATPCGTVSATNTMEFMGQEFTSVTTYEYTDANCSYKEYIDGVLEETVTKDNKFSPYVDPQAYTLGMTGQHNITKVVNHFEESTHNIVYTYNELNFPTKAVHTFEGTDNVNYTEEFIYY